MKPTPNVYRSTDDPSVTQLVITRQSGEQFIVKFSSSDLPDIQRRRWRIITTAHGRRIKHVGSGSNGADAVMLGRYLLEPDDDQVIRHLNGDGLDCRGQNLAISTRAKISLDTTPTRSKIGQRNIYPDRDYGFNVTANRLGKRISVGYTSTLAGAIELRDAWLAGDS